MSWKSRFPSVPTAVLFVGLAVLLRPGTSAGQEEATEPASAAALNAAEAQEFLGEWVLEMESPQGAFEADLALTDVDGKVVAELGMPRFGNRTIDDITRSDEGLRLAFDSTFGDQSFNMVLDLVRDGEGLEGGLAEENGLFQIPFTGVTRQAFLARDSTGDGDGDGRRRGRFGSSNETKLALADKEIRVRFDGTKTSDEAYALVTEPRSGQVVSFLRARPSKLWTDVDLRFGDTVIETENIAADYPGVYSLWLKKTDDGWNLVFNELADVWGTQHDPAHDVAEVPLTVEPAPEETEELTVELEETEGGGLLKIVWGDTVWQAPFRVDGAAKKAGG